MDCSPPGPSVHGFPWQEFWSELLFPSPGDLLGSGIEPESFALAGGAIRETQNICYYLKYRFNWASCILSGNPS